MANACTPARPVLIDDICFQASKRTYNFDPVRAVLHAGGAVESQGASYRILVLFALVSSKPITLAKREALTSHAVVRWLQARGKPLPAQTTRMSDIAVRELRECFDGIDTKGDGCIYLPQLRAALRGTALFADSSHINALFQQMDADNSGYVEWAEFLTAITAFTADPRGDELADDGGSGTLGENVRG